MRDIQPETRKFETLSPRTVSGAFKRRWKWYAAAIAFAIFLLSFTPASYFLWGVSSFTDLFSNKLGFGESISYALSIPLTFAYTMVIPIAWRWMFFSARGSKNIIVSFLSVAFVFGSKPLLLSLLATPFTPDGTTQKCYSMRGREIVLLEKGSNGCGIDPLTGGQTREVTPTIMDAINRKSRPVNQIPLTGAPIQFFDNATGMAIVWYDRGTDGTFQLFDSDGTNPETGRALKAVTPDIAAEINRQNQDIQRKQTMRAFPVEDPAALSVNRDKTVVQAQAPTSSSVQALAAQQTSRELAREPSQARSPKPNFVHEASGSDSSPRAASTPPPLRLETPLQGN